MDLKALKEKLVPGYYSFGPIGVVADGKRAAFLRLRRFIASLKIFSLISFYRPFSIGGHLEVLKAISFRDVALYSNFMNSLARDAISFNQMGVLRFLLFIDKDVFQGSRVPSAFIYILEHENKLRTPRAAQQLKRILEFLISQGAVFDKEKLLNAAAFYGDPFLIEYILDLGANMTEDYRQPFLDGKSGTLLSAIRGRSVEAARFLIQKGADPLADESLLEIASSEADNVEMVKLFIGKGASQRALSMALDVENIQICLYLQSLMAYDQFIYDWILSIAAKREDFKVLRYINSQGYLNKKISYIWVRDRPISAIKVLVALGLNQNLFFEKEEDSQPFQLRAIAFYRCLNIKDIIKKI